MNLKLPFQTESLARQITVKSAVNAPLWSCVGVSVPLFWIGTNVSGLIQIVILITASLLVILFIFSYLYFMFKDPSYLRSEEYQLKANTLKLLGDKDNPLDINADIAVKMINNPRIPDPADVKYVIIDKKSAIPKLSDE